MIDEELRTSEVDDIEDLTVRAQSPKSFDPDEGPHYTQVVPDGARLVVLDTETALHAPIRTRGTAKVWTGAALIAYVQAHKTAAAALWADARAARVVAVLNGATELPGWGDHRCVLTMRRTPEWQRWLDSDGQAMTQVEFGEFLETNSADIVSPPAADLQQVSAHLVRR